MLASRLFVCKGTGGLKRAFGPVPARRSIPMPRLGALRMLHLLASGTEEIDSNDSPGLGFPNGGAMIPSQSIRLQLPRHKHRCHPKEPCPCSSF